MRLIGTISILSIQKQINAVNLKLLQNYQKLLDEGNQELIRQFIHDEMALLDGEGNRIDLVGEGFEVSACVKGLSLIYQDSAVNLDKVLEYRLRDKNGTTVYCDITDEGDGIEFYYDNE